MSNEILLTNLHLPIVAIVEQITIIISHSNSSTTVFGIIPMLKGHGAEI